jgi:hypothetical protein
MCGHAGFARQPGHSDISLIRQINESLIRGIAHRGKHATGIATVGGSNPFIWKWAVDPLRAVSSEPWAKLMDDLAADTPYGISHVRYATQNNAHMDAAAHPFRIGKVTGAHNGVIRNWNELRSKVQGGKGWIVDSEAAFALLNAHDNPNEALDHLDGYWALVWTRDGKLHFARDNKAPLAAAYVPTLRTLFWCSELDVLRRVLKAHLSVPFEAWGCEPKTIYQYDVNLFTAEGTGVVKSDATFRGQGADVKVDQRTNGGAWRTNASANDVHALREELYASERKTPRKRKGGGRSVAVTEPKGRELRALPPLTSGEVETRGGVSMIGMASVVRALVDRVNLLTDQVHYMATRNQELETELELLNGRVESAEAEVAYCLDTLVDEFDAPQLGLGFCKRCGLGEDAGEMLELPGGRYIHGTCVAEELEDATARKTAGAA